MSNKDHYVIIGNGPAGNRAATILRKNDIDAKITIISDESIPFYYKNKLTSYISGEISKQDLIVTQPDIYEEKNIRVRLGQAVNRIDPEKKIIQLRHKEQVHYTKLIIASGSKSRILPSMVSFGSHLKHVVNYMDVIELKDEIRRVENLFILGGDLVGIRFLKMLSAMGKNVSMILYPQAFWPFDLTGKNLEKIMESLSKYSNDIMGRDDVSDIIRDKDQFRVKTLNGVERVTDMILSFTGLAPNIDFAIGTGIDIDHGILVNEYMHSNLSGIYACGSCAQIYNPRLKSYATSVGWENALIQGEVAAFNLLGDSKKITPAPMKYFNLEGVKIKTTWWEDIEE